MAAYQPLSVLLIDSRQQRSICPNQGVTQQTVKRMQVPPGVNPLYHYLEAGDCAGRAYGIPFYSRSPVPQQLRFI